MKTKMELLEEIGNTPCSHKMESCQCSRVSCFLTHLDVGAAAKHPEVIKAAVERFLEYRMHRTPFSVVYHLTVDTIESVEQNVSKGSAVQHILNVLCEVQYYYYKYCHVGSPKCDINVLLSYTSFLNRENLKNILTLTTNWEVNSEPCRSGNFRFCQPLQSCYTTKLIYLLLNLGLNQVVSSKILGWLNKLKKSKISLPDNVIALDTAVRQPPSLLQLARLSVRKSMRDVHVLEDCYKLPIPHHLQDYLSLRSLDAKIRPWFIKKEKPALMDYERYEMPPSDAEDPNCDPEYYVRYSDFWNSFVKEPGWNGRHC